MMRASERRGRYIALWCLALAFGWIEGAVVVYLREVHAAGASVAGFEFPIASLPGRIFWTEIVREASTLVLLGAAGWLAGVRRADRIGAFLLLFGIWDLVYYAVLYLILGWPDRLTTWDILFLIPLPWVAPVWAPATVAAIFVAAGSYLFLAEVPSRRYSAGDAAIVLAGASMVVGSFLVDWRVVLDREMPLHFPAWLFWAGVVLGAGWFVHVERRSRWDVRLNSVRPGWPAQQPWRRFWPLHHPSRLRPR